MVPPSLAFVAALMKPPPDALNRETTEALRRYLLTRGEEPERVILAGCSLAEEDRSSWGTNVRHIAGSEPLARGPIELLVFYDTVRDASSPVLLESWLDWVTHGGYLARVSRGMDPCQPSLFSDTGLGDRGFLPCEDASALAEGMTLWRRHRAGSEDLVGLKSALRGLASTPSLIERAMETLRQKDGESVHLGEGAAEARALLCELGDFEKAWVTALRLDLPEAERSEDSPSPALPVPRLPHGHRRSLGELLDRFRHLRSRTLKFLKQDSDEAWLQVISHPVFGERTRAECVRRAARRDLHFRKLVIEISQRGIDEFGGADARSDSAAPPRP